MKENHQQKLLGEFELPSYEQWLELVSKQLKGAPFEKKLVKQTTEGFSIQPIYRKEDGEGITLSVPGEFPFPRGAKASGHLTRGWDIAHPYRYADPEELGEAVAFDAEKGLTSFLFNLDEPSGNGMNPDQGPQDKIGDTGVSLFCRDDIQAVLNGIDLDRVSLLVRPRRSYLPLMILLVSALKKIDIDPVKLNGCLAADPLSLLAEQGISGFALENQFREMAACIKASEKHTPNLRTLGIDIFPYSEAGASASQELALAMATGVEYIRKLQTYEIDVDEIASNAAFFIPVGSDFFMSIAKLRAARILWAKVIKACGGSKENQRMVIHAGTMKHNKTVYDPHVNILRVTTEAYSAVLGGSDSVSVAPFDEVLGLPDEFSRRVSRNIQIILKEECHGHRVIDPAGGSWYLENLTEKLAEQGWHEFQKIEEIGGLTVALENGYVQQEIAKVVDHNHLESARRKKVIVGTNMYPNLEEHLPETVSFDQIAFAKKRIEKANSHAQSGDSESLTGLAPDALFDRLLELADQGTTLGGLSGSLGRSVNAGTDVRALTIHRQAEPYEKLRQKAEAYRNATGERPKVFLANMGPLRQHKARADYSTGFLQPGGFEVIQGAGYDTAEEAIEGSLASKARIMVICSKDDTYPDLVPVIAAGIKKQDTGIVVIVAGYPKDHVEAFQKAGVDEFIHLKANNLELLTRLQEKAGVAI